MVQKREDIVLVADGGALTIGRRAATYVYGNFDVTLPEGMAQKEQDDRLQDGYIYRPQATPTGRFDIGFARADAHIDLQSQTSDLEQVTDAAQDRVEGDVFFERDITRAGLGRFVPGRDFDVGDVVSVEVWGKQLPLPVTAIDVVASEGDGVVGHRVHVGGQVLADVSALEVHNLGLRRQVDADRRRLLASVQRAQSTANRSHSLVSPIDADLSKALSRFTSSQVGLDNRLNFMLGQVNQDVSAAQSRADSAHTILTQQQDVMVTNTQLSNALRTKVGTTDFSTYQGRVHEDLWTTQSAINSTQSQFNQIQSYVNSWTQSAIRALDRRIPVAMGPGDDFPGVGRAWRSGSTLYFQKYFPEPCTVFYVGWRNAILSAAISGTFRITGGENDRGSASVGVLESFQHSTVIVFRETPMPSPLWRTMTTNNFTRSQLRS